MSVGPTLEVKEVENLHGYGGHCTVHKKRIGLGTIVIIVSVMLSHKNNENFN